MTTKFIKNTLEQRRIVAVFAVFSSIFILGAALSSQYFGGLYPCQLCIYQRIPYVFAIAFGLLTYATSNISAKTSIIFLILTTLSFYIDAGIAGFHVGVEQEWWEGLTGCASSIPDATASIEELRTALLNAPIIRCSDIAFELFGISMAGYNFLTALILGDVMLISLILTWKKDKT